MTRFMNLRPNTLATTVLLLLMGLCAVPPSHAGDNSKGTAMIFLSPDGPSPFVLTGTASHFGRFRCYGELELQPGMAEGSLDGVGVVALEAANGDQIVGVVSCHLDSDGVGQIHFSWRDSVEFSDGTTASNTGRFQRRRPPGVVIALIAILIG